MDAYDMIKTSIDNNLSKENIESNESVISVYDLYKILDKKFEKLRSVTQNKSLFTSKELFGIKSYYETHVYRSSSTLSILVLKDKNYFDGNKFYINKDLGSDSDKIYLSGYSRKVEKFVNNFVKKYYDEIVEVFSILEMYHDLIFQCLYSEHSGSDFKFDIVISFDGQVDLKVSVNTNVDLGNYVYREFFNKESIDDMLTKSKYELAKKTPIKMNSLKEPFKQIVTEYYEQKKPKVKIIEGIAIGW